MQNKPRTTPAGGCHGFLALLVRMGLAIAAGTLFFANAASAQPGSRPNVVEVVVGDTFSSIAARYTGNVRTWADLYDAQRSGLGDPNRIEPGMRFELVAEADGRRYLRLMGGAAASRVMAAPAKTAPSAAPAPTASTPPLPADVAAARGDTLVVGVLPNIAAAALTAQYDHLRNYFERLNAQKVFIVVPANFKAFFDSMSKGEYDLAVSASHFARVAQLDARLVPLALYEPRISALFITPIDSTLASPSELRGKALAFANPQSLVALYGQQWLRQQGLEPGKDVEVKAARTDLGVGRMLLTGEVAAAIMSNGEFRSIPQDESVRLKIRESFASIPNFIVMGHPRLGAERLARLKSQLLAFPADKDDGAAFAKAAGINAIVDADDATLRELDPYVAPTRRAMGGGN
jgi:phosphonate transport system substrate-binding protein